jgi:uridine phosphorylase
VDLALIEDDLGAKAFIEPTEVIGRIDMPSRVVFCFFSEVVAQIAARDDAREVDVLVWAHGPHPIYEIGHQGQRLGVVQAGVGAPLSAGLMEELIALGGREFVAVGGAGCLVPELVMGHAIVVDSAVRDEGTSFHYLPPSRVVDSDPEAAAALSDSLREAGVPFVVGRTWTTDGVYRETRARAERRVAEGCISVDMEASALIAVARYRGVRLANLLYAGDSLAGEEWEHRGWHSATSLREQMFWFAADAVLRLPTAELP